VPEEDHGQQEKTSMNATPQPNTAAELFERAFQHQQAGNFQQAEQIYRQILQVDPRHVDALHMLGLLAHQVGRNDLALDFIGQALRLRPDFFGGHLNLGNILQEMGRLSEAVASYRQALRHSPDSAEAHSNLGAAHYKQGKLEEAVLSYQQALRLMPGYAEAQANLGVALWGQGRLEEAVACYQQAIQLKPAYVDAYSHLAVALKHQGKLDEALACYRQALRFDPKNVQAHNNLLFALHNRSGITSAELAEAHAEFERQHAAPLRAAWKPHANVRDPERKLRLGLISPDFAAHPVGYFLIRALENLDRSEALVVCYSNRPIPDAMTERFRRAATVWRDVVALSDAQLAEQVRADQIDILFDLAGHTAGNRLLAFARKPAPIQISWAGYVGTTGLTAMDYVLADRYQVPAETQRHYCERILRLPDAYICYDPPDYAPGVAPLPALAAGRVTFGSFNNQAKLTPEAIRLWAKILQRVPQSRLVLKYRGMSDRSVAIRLTEMFVSAGIEPGRVEFLGASHHADLLEHYNRIDIALDPFPYSGGLTTCEALWMGVPVITSPGETFAARHSLTHLSNIGLTETIAPDLDAYVEVAVALASDLPRLAALRARLREQMAGSPLCDSPRFARNLINVLRDAWRQYCADR
jgi:predicted O-linked N-acetylglucosamine transferase (SPINDLY family)